MTLYITYINIFQINSNHLYHLSFLSAPGSETFPLPPCPSELWVPEPKNVARQPPALYLGPVTCLERRHEAGCNFDVFFRCNFWKKKVLKKSKNAQRCYENDQWCSVIFSSIVICSVILTGFFSHHFSASRLCNVSRLVSRLVRFSAMVNGCIF